MKRVREVNWLEPRLGRAGLIPVARCNGKTFYGFGVNEFTGNLTDFGGRRESSDLDALDTALREYREESLDIFGPLDRGDIQDLPVLESEHNVDILLPVLLSEEGRSLALDKIGPTPSTLAPFYRYTERFHELVKRDPAHEAQSIIWLTGGQVRNALRNRRVALSEIGHPHAFSYAVFVTLEKNEGFL